MGDPANVAYDPAAGAAAPAAVLQRGEHVLTIASPQFRTSLLEFYCACPPYS